MGVGRELMKLACYRIYPSQSYIQPVSLIKFMHVLKTA